MYQHSGFTLLEVLIALLVFSIGLIGLAGMQVAGLKLGHDSALRSSAIILAGDIADRMRANHAAFMLITNNPYDNPGATTVGNPSCLGKDGSGADTDAQCTPNEMALHDFYEWQAKIGGQSATAWHPAYRAQLPAGSGVVCIDSTPEDGAPPPGDPACDGIITTPGKPLFAIKLWWRERKDEASPGTLQQFVTSLSP